MNVIREIQYPFYIFLVRSPASLHHIPFHSIIPSLSGLSPQSPLFIISSCIKTSMASHCLLHLLGFKAFQTWPNLETMGCGGRRMYLGAEKTNDSIPTLPPMGFWAGYFMFPWLSLIIYNMKIQFLPHSIVGRNYISVIKELNSMTSTQVIGKSSLIFTC